jgi:hypothetical protein
VLTEATATIMADITGLVAQLRHETPPPVPYDPVAARRAAAGSPEDSAGQKETPA